MANFSSVDAVLRADAIAVTQWLDAYFKKMDTSASELSDAMAYAALNGGKRLRASLVLSAARLAGDAHLAEPVAAAIEMIHAYSLIHDDLPAMDDAETRRGKPSTHIAFNEATAILAGDALQSEAFYLLSTSLRELPASLSLLLVRTLAEASGVLGMAGGQMLDLAAEKQSPDLAGTRRMQELKTGALIRSAAVMGVIVGGGDDVMQERVGRYAAKLGFAFQIADDIMDYRSTVDMLGKPVGRDAEQGKASFVVLLGLEQAKQKAAQLIEDAIIELAPYGERADELKSLAAFSIHRKS